MMKWMMYLALAALVGGSWLLYSNKGGEMAKLEAQIEALEEKGDLEAKAPELKTELQSIEGERTFNGILLAFLSAGLVGIFFVLQILPSIAQRITHSVYDSAEMVERDVMHDARSLMAQGEYEGAIQAFQQAAAADPLNRLPWVEIAKIQKDNLGDPAAAIETIRYALESREWETNDAAYFLFRLAELYDQVNGDRVSAMAIMQQVIDQFPDTRHSANASHKLHDWSMAANEATAAAEEQAYLDQLSQTAESSEILEPETVEEAAETPYDPERPA